MLSMAMHSCLSAVQLPAQYHILLCKYTLQPACTMPGVFWFLWVFCNQHLAAALGRLAASVLLKRLRIRLFGLAGIVTELCDVCGRHSLLYSSPYSGHYCSC